jgi:hypothetical protein
MISLKEEKYWLSVFFITVIFIIFDLFTLENISNILWTVYYFVLGFSCLWNYRNCKRAHCQITGFGFLAVGIIALVNLIYFNFPWYIIWFLLVAVLVIALIVEFMYKSNTGSFYRK